MMATVGSRNM